MGIDLNALKQSFNSLQNKSKKTDNLWKPKKGKQRIRILPYQHDLSNPFRVLYFHWNVARQTLLSPVTFGRPDPINEFANKLKQSGDKEDWLQGRKLEAKQRIFVPMIVRNKDGSVDMETGVKFWGFGKTIYEDLLKIILDPDYGDITDPTTGRDIEVTYVPQEESDTNFPKTEILVKPKEVPVTEDEDEFTSLMESQIEITDIYPEKSYEELVEIFTGWLDAGGSADDDDRDKGVSKDTSKGDASPTLAASNEKKVDLNDAESAFAKMFSGK